MCLHVQAAQRNMRTPEAELHDSWSAREQVLPSLEINHRDERYFNQTGKVYWRKSGTNGHCPRAGSPVWL